ncbi:unnamed protein product [Schistosoma margrebowiei]|uniref:Uncharacterized protein n=1 Tax=Schistosoma margrebowiei TaxID=48269 RepID=A0A183M8V8_9TREM|nr:unnamed protein product [Schistosoma margrebowiei]
MIIPLTSVQIPQLTPILMVRMTSNPYQSSDLLVSEITFQNILLIAEYVLIVVDYT